MASTMEMDWEDARERLKVLREDQARCSEEVVELWECILSAFTHKLGNELWMVYEQVCIAALDCGRSDIAMNCIHALDHNFPSSKRVARLKGLYFEANEKYDKAEKLYERILEEDDTNSAIKKRLVALLKAQNRIPEAIKILNDYLKSFMSDYEAWMELGDLYLHVQDYNKASFCYEELIMSSPHNHLYYQKYAEIKYTQGGQDNMEIARTNFAQAIKLNNNNMRALFGLFLSASNLASAKGVAGKAKVDNTKYAAWAAEQIADRYKLNQTAVSPSKEVDELLANLRITSS